MPNYPVPYQNTWNYSGIGQQMYPQYPSSAMQQVQQTPATTQNAHALIWVDGEVGAKAYQMPAGWPANQPIALWDTNDTVIYLKSINPMGMPNPLQKACYKLEGMNSGEKVSGHAEPDMSEYVRKEDLDKMKHELMETIDGLSISGRKAAQKGE